MENIYPKEIIEHVFNKAVKYFENPKMYSPEEFKIGLICSIDTMPYNHAFKEFFIQNINLLQTDKSISQNDIHNHIKKIIDYGTLEGLLDQDTNTERFADEITTKIIETCKHQSPRLNQDAISRFDEMQQEL